MTRGGKRAGAGRPRGSNRYKEPTKPIRVPESKIEDVLAFVQGTNYDLPFYSCAVQAGFPSPADDHLEGSLDLNKHLVKNPAATFFVRASGDSMVDAGINSGDILVVDRSLAAKNGKIVIAVIEGQLTVKRLNQSAQGAYLTSENAHYPNFKIDEEQGIVVWGVVTNVLHAV